MDACEYLFSPAALAILNGQQYDPAAKGSYELFSGGLMWPDETPDHGAPGRELLSLGLVYRYLIAYRADITLGEGRAEFRPVWEQVVQHAPNWPGLRPERRGEQARRWLLAAKRRADRCLDELERRFDEEQAAKAAGEASPGGATDVSPG
jgi:hypothetical protein